MPTHTLSPLSSLAVYQDGSGPSVPTSFAPVMTTSAGVAPFFMDNYVDLTNFLTDRSGVLLFDDGGIPVTATITQVQMQTLHKENPGSRAAHNYHPVCGYRANDTTANQRFRSYDGHVGDYAPTVNTTWNMTETTVNWTGLAFTRADLFSLVWVVGATCDTSNNPADSAAVGGLYNVANLQVVVTYTVPAPTEVDITGSGGAQVAGTALQGFGVTGAGGAVVSHESDRVIGAGAGTPPELHANQWGLLHFVMKARLEERI